MKNKLISVALASALMFGTQAGMAASSDEYYFGIQYAAGEYDEDGISKSFSPDAFVMRLGGYFNPNFSVEGRLGTGSGDDTQFLPEFGVSFTLDLDTIMGVYAVGHLDLSESSSIYALLGVTQIEGKAHSSGIPRVSDSSTNSSSSYGVGADFDISDNVILNLEYMQYLNRSNFDLSAIALGVTFSF